LSAGIDDIDLNFDDFIKKNNGDLVGKVVNIASRSAKFVNDSFQGMLADHLDSPALFDNVMTQAPKIAEVFEQRNYASAVRLIMELADVANQYIDEQKPWVLAKTNPKDPRIQVVATMGLNLYRLLIIFLKPIVPKLAQDSERFLRIAPLQWQDYQKPLLHHNIDMFNPLLIRVDPQSVARLLTFDEKK
jgi:methionyl-tRNA synthetase